MDTVLKKCNRCKVEKPFSEFYPRSGYTKPDNLPTVSGHYIGDCKACMKDRSKTQVRLPKTIPRAATEIIGIDILKKAGIPTLPGKAVHAADVDLVCYGSVWVECKYSRLVRQNSEDAFKFDMTPKQQKGGFRADLVMLICDYPDGERTAHLFDAKHPVFYMQGRVKSGLVYTVGLQQQRKHFANRTVMTEPMMNEAKDAFYLIKNRLFAIELELKRGETLPFEIATREILEQAA